MKENVAKIMALLLLFCCIFGYAGASGGNTVEVGSTIWLGHYEQDGDQNNGAEPVEWIVLEVKDNCALVLSKYCLECKPFNNKKTDLVWAESTLRAWLNETFIHQVFSDDELSIVMETEVEAKKHPEYQNLYQGDNTIDKLFLLSYDEADSLLTKKQREAEITPFIGTLTSSSGTGMWWLRTSAYSHDSAAAVSSWGEIGSFYCYYVTSEKYIRPAMTIDVTAYQDYASSHPEIKENKELSVQKDLTVSFEGTNIGDIVCFGHFEQDGDYNNGSEPIEWIILESNDNDFLLISKKILHNMPFSNLYSEKVWETCSLRSWLNESFISTAFSDQEADCLILNTLKADTNPDYPNLSQGYISEDKVYLLSYPEAKQYMEKVPSIVKVEATTFAKDKGATTEWWIRTMGFSKFGASYVTGSRISWTMNSNDEGVRPVIRIDREKALEMAGEPSEDTHSAEEAPTEPVTETEGPVSEGQVCKNCGYHVKEGETFKFCPECGTRFD